MVRFVTDENVKRVARFATGRGVGSPPAEPMVHITLWDSDGSVTYVMTPAEARTVSAALNDSADRSSE